MKSRKLFTITVACLPLLYVAPLVGADVAKDFPNRPIRLIVPNAAGSSVDILGRIVANKLSEVIGQQVVVDNRAGAGGVVGMEIGKNANPDGYTLISASTPAMSVAPHIQKKLPYDPLNDFAFISQFAITPNVLVVTPGLPIKSVKDFIDYAKSKQGQVNMAHAGPGSQIHMSGMYFMRTANFPSLPVSYRGGGPAVAAIMAGESHWALTPAPAVMSLVKSGRLRAIAHSLPKRTALLGEVPAIAESIPGFEYSGWQGLIAPKGTTKAIVHRLRGALISAASLPEVKDALAAQATEIVTGTPEEFRKLVHDSLVQNGKLVRAVGLKIE